MYYDEVIIDGELFCKTDPKGGWIRATNKMLTERLDKARLDLLEAEATIEKIRDLLEKHNAI